ncbi:hypothetical protein ABNF65_24345, partial [Paenibacillus larvae]
KEIGNFIVDKDYKYEKMVLKTFGGMEEHLEILIKNHTQSPLYIDNFSIVKMGRGIDELRKENKDYAGRIDPYAKYYISPVSDEQMVIANVNNEAVMKKNTNENKYFRFAFDETDNSFVIIDTKKVLTWDKLKSKITFESGKIETWYLKKSTNPNQMGYQIINYLDRSKVLEYDTDNDGKVKDGKRIRIATLDENKPSQYFQFPQKA